MCDTTLIPYNDSQLRLWRARLSTLDLSLPDSSATVNHLAPGFTSSETTAINEEEYDDSGTSNIRPTKLATRDAGIARTASSAGRRRRSTFGQMLTPALSSSAAATTTTTTTSDNTTNGENTTNGDNTTNDDNTTATATTTRPPSGPTLNAAPLIEHSPDQSSMATTGAPAPQALPGVQVATTQSEAPAPAVNVATRGKLGGIWVCCRCRKWISSPGHKCIRVRATGERAPAFEPCLHLKCQVCDDLTDAGREEVERNGRPLDTEPLVSEVGEAVPGHDSSVWI
ncbi:hypothetical protein LZ554_004248 [Drepanopeziza brunnea f. sp. 'monogermtubi']|nr:hypothetical protein LZ554_004248 [Drepanopeziza brunnea f. sp. 'monogermtubi']